MQTYNIIKHCTFSFYPKGSKVSANFKLQKGLQREHFSSLADSQTCLIKPNGLNNKCSIHFKIIKILILNKFLFYLLEREKPYVSVFMVIDYHDLQKYSKNLLSWDQFWKLFKHSLKSSSIISLSVLRYTIHRCSLMSVFCFCYPKTSLNLNLVFP